jgi:hypothetical protein
VRAGQQYGNYESCAKAACGNLPVFEAVLRFPASRSAVVFEPEK